MNIKTYLGPPGTGKTETLIRLVERALKTGTRLDRVGYVSFTNAAVDVAISRTGKVKNDLPYFRTLHSLCFKLCGLSTSSVMQPEHYSELGERLGLEITGRHERAAGYEELSIGDLALAVVELSRVTFTNLAQAYEVVSELVDWPLVEQLSRALTSYRDMHCLVDFTAMLEMYLKTGLVPELDLLVVDEAQDLSPLQWRVVDKIASSCKNLVIAGDDDQMLYHWAGARFSAFQEVALKGETETLNQSYRIPNLVHVLASKILKGISARLPKKYSPRSAAGSVEHVASLDDVDLSEGQWLILVRNRYMAASVTEHCYREGLHYESFSESPRRWRSMRAAVAWERLRRGREVEIGEILEVARFAKKGWCNEITLNFLSSKKDAQKVDASRLRVEQALLEKPWFEILTGIHRDETEYLRSALRRGEKLSQPPRIRVDTIHGAKGAEAENVVLFTDMSRRTALAMEHERDPELRVFYVGVTRARENLKVVQPATEFFIDLENM